MWQFSEALTSAQLVDEGEAAKIGSGPTETKADNRSLFVKLWDDVFGSGEEKTAKTAASNASTSLEDSKSATNQGSKDDKLKVQGDDTILSISITRYKPQVTPATTNTLETPDPEERP